MLLFFSMHGVLDIWDGWEQFGGHVGCDSKMMCCIEIVYLSRDNKYTKYQVLQIDRQYANLFHTQSVAHLWVKMPVMETEISFSAS